MAYDLGIVIPVYRSRESVKKLVLELEKTFLPDIKIRICLVDDSNDEDTAVIFHIEYKLRQPRTLITP